MRSGAPPGMRRSDEIRPGGAPGSPPRFLLLQEIDFCTFIDVSSWLGGLGRSRGGRMRPREVDQALRGIERCRSGDWGQGLGLIAGAATSAERGALPGLAFSYLGYGIAYREGRL